MNYVEYEHRACKACGKRIPRWTDGKLTPAARVFCNKSCGSFYRRLHPVKGGAQTLKKRPIPSAFLEPVRAVVGRSEFGPCESCGRPCQIEPGKPTYCNERCRDYVPLPARKVDGEFFIVAGPVDYCSACAMAIMPRKPHGYITPYRKDGRLYCSPLCRDRGHDHPDGEVFVERPWRTVISSDGVVCEVLDARRAGRARRKEAA
jgi:hypothetical protein